ncbi:aldehyde dehydrogenase (ALDH) [Monocercomonoides exilis]|uniref:aldehyde dehydrogenase (ALDH) n=1 Tax=Monocercomonoides exilis TaxID=2049356 RepID=UPI00355A4EFB|nr:aldehyde dehydrogenase (ALDH) [Monocercomonoides exilis]
MIKRCQQRDEDVKSSKQFYTPASQIEFIHSILVQSFRAQKTKSYEYRMTQLTALRRMIDENEKTIFEALYSDLHKNKASAYMTEVGMVKADVEEAINNLKSWMTPERVSTPLVQMKGLSTSSIYPEPLGCALIISPWNYPFALSLQPLIGAISAGCCACIKPSSVTCKTSHIMSTLIARYLDNSCYVVVEGSHDVSDALLALKWDIIFFTGSGTIGKDVYRKATNWLCPVVLELGGKSPAIIDSTANLNVTAKRLTMGKLLNSGQTCVAPDYVLCDETMVEPLVVKLKEIIAEFYGEDAQKSEDYVRIVAQRQFDRLTGMLKNDAETDDEKVASDNSPSSSSSSSSSTSPSSSSESSSSQAGLVTYTSLPSNLKPTQNGGHRILFGGRSDPDDLFIEPTLILCAPNTTSRFMKEEIFGPILPIVPIPSQNFLNDCVDFITSRDKPLACYYFTQSQKNKEFIASRVSSGSMAFNECVLQLQIQTLPFGGVGESGMGMYHGKFSFNTFSHRKALLDKANSFDIESRYPPYTEKKLNLIKRFM